MNRWLTRQRFWKGVWQGWRYAGLTLITFFVVTFGQYAYGAISPIDSVGSSVARITATPEVTISETTSLENLVANASRVSDYLDRGQALYDIGQYGAAISTWQKTLTLAQSAPYQRAIIHNYLAIAHQSLSQWQQADIHIRQGLTLLEGNQNTAFLTAQLLNTQGSNQLQTGDAAAALDTWQQAIDHYQTMSSDETAAAIARTRLNQAQALRVLGFYRRAKATLDTVRTDLTESTPPEVKLTVLQSLGQTLLRTGDLAQAQAILTEALPLAHTPEQQADIQLDLAQTTAALGDSQTALTLYQTVRNQGTPNIQLEATLKQLALKLETANSPDFAWSNLDQELGQLLPKLSSLPPSRWGINSQVYLANLLIDNVGMEQLANLNISPSDIAQQLAHAINQARNIEDTQAEATALEQLGHLYEQNQQWTAALELTQQSLALLPSALANYANAQGQWQLGRILKAQGATEQAISAFGGAVSQLDTLQYDLVALNPDAKFSFRDRIEPVYRGYVELLLIDIDQQPASLQQQRLEQARDTMEALQLAELQNYFRETCLTYQTREIETIDPQAAIIYPIVLRNRLEVIFSLPHQPLLHHSVDLTAVDQETLFQNILGSLHPVSSINAVVPFGQQLYDWLIAPIALQLEQQTIETLVFVPDGFLRNIPMAILYDGQGYLVEHYSLALTPSMQLLNSRPLASDSLSVLTAGLTTARQGFSSLPGVAQEIDQIKQLVSAKVLINNRFTKDRIIEKSEDNEFSIVHLATHGQFSASAEDTFLLTWNDRINVKDLGELFQSSQRRDTPIELLVLSACQTAQGDRRAALGMAGVAIESGARSTVATLWNVQDTSTSILMSEFYQQLIKTQQPRAQALRNAQLTLMQSSDYQHPYYWAPFVMIGNWQ